MCNCSASNPTFKMKLNTTWDSVSIKFPYDISNDTIEIDIKEYGSNTVVKRITSNDVLPNSRIARNNTINTIYPIIKAADTTLFDPAKLYDFDVALVSTIDGTIRRSGICFIRSEAVITGAV